MIRATVTVMAAQPGRVNLTIVPPAYNRELGHGGRRRCPGHDSDARATVTIMMSIRALERGWPGQLACCHNPQASLRTVPGAPLRNTMIIRPEVGTGVTVDSLPSLPVSR